MSRTEVRGFCAKTIEFECVSWGHGGIIRLLRAAMGSNGLSAEALVNIVRIRSGSLSPVLRGEGWGEGPGVKVALLPEWPLTLTLSPEYRGEGTRATQKIHVGWAYSPTVCNLGSDGGRVRPPYINTELLLHVIYSATSTVSSISTAALPGS